MATFDTLEAQWAYIVSALQAQQNVGASGVPGGGTNSSGTLQGVKLVGDSIWPEFNSLPYVGVQLAEWEETWKAATRAHDILSKFEIIVVVSVQASASNLIQLRDAMRSLRALISDGNGNGVLPILQANDNFFLGGNAYQTLTTGGTLYWEKNPTGKGTEYIAYSLLRLSAWQRVVI